jgi:MFS family permease
VTRDFILVLLSLTTWGIGEGAFFYFQPLRLEELGASPLVIGGILGGMGLAMSLVHIPAGYLSDRIGRRQLMWASWWMGIIATAIMAAANTLALFSIGIILYALTVFTIAPLNSYVTSARGKLSVEQAMTTNSAGYFLGGILGPLIGGLLANRFSLQTIYLFSCTVFCLSTIIISFIRQQPTEDDPEGSAWEILHDRSFTRFLPLVFLVVLALYLPQPLAPNFLKNQRGISLQSIGVLGSILNLGSVVINLLFGVLPPRMGLVLGQIFVGFSALLVWQTSGMPPLVGAYFLLGGFRATRSLMLAQIEKLVSRSNLGLAYGFFETVSALALTAAPPLAGVLYAWDPVLIFSAPLILIVPLIIFTVITRKMPWNI